MSFKAVRDAIYEHFTTGWNAGAGAIVAPEGVPEILYENLDEPTREPSGDYYVKILVLDQFSDQRSFGEAGCRLFAREANLTIKLYTPGGIGADVNDDLADLALGLFEGESLFYEAGKRIDFRRVRRVGIGSAGSLYQTNVVADVEYDVRK